MFINAAQHMAPKKPTQIALPTYIKGTNVSSMTTYYATQFPPKYYPEDSGSNTFPIKQADVDYIASKGFNFVRLLFSHEIIQPNGAFTDFDTKAIGYLKDQVDMFMAKGNIHVSLAVHAGDDPGFGKYYGNTFVKGGTVSPGAVRADFYRRLAEIFRSYDRLHWSFDNEPQGQNINIFSWMQECINAVAHIHGGKHFINGGYFSGGVSWTNSGSDQGSPKISNATAALTLTHPYGIDNLIFCTHNYANSAAGGGSTVVPTTTVLKDEAQGFYQWLVDNNRYGIIEEWGVQQSSTNAVACSQDFINWVKSVSVTLGGRLYGQVWWTYGRPIAWSGYQYTLAPTSMTYVTDSAQMTMITSQGYFTDPVAFDPLTAVPGIYARHRASDYNVGTSTLANSAGVGDSTRNMVLATGGNFVAADFSTSDSDFNGLASIGSTSVTGGRNVGLVNAGGANLTTAISGACTVYGVYFINAAPTPSSAYLRSNRTILAGGSTTALLVNSPGLYYFYSYQSTRDNVSVVGGSTGASGVGTVIGVKIICTVLNGASSATYVNSNTALSTGNAGTASITSLGYGNPNGQAAVWRMSQTLIYSAAHTTGERTSVMNYLGQLYGITIA